MKFQHILFEHAKEQLDVLYITLIKCNLQSMTLKRDRSHYLAIFCFNVTRISLLSRRYNAKKS